MKDYIKEICQICFNQLPDGIDNFFFHCVFEENTVGPSLYYKTRGFFPILKYIIFPSDEYQILIDFWNEGLPEGKKEKWEISCIKYFNNQFSLDLIYPNEISDDERNDYKFREKIIERYFGKIKVEYPKYV